MVICDRCLIKKTLKKQSISVSTKCSTSTSRHLKSRLALVAFDAPGSHFTCKVTKHKLLIQKQLPVRSSGLDKTLLLLLTNFGYAWRRSLTHIRQTLLCCSTTKIKISRARGQRCALCYMGLPPFTVQDNNTVTLLKILLLNELVYYLLFQT